jgi:hypothetical protein
MFFWCLSGRIFESSQPPTCNNFISVTSSFPRELKEFIFPGILKDLLESSFGERMFINSIAHPTDRQNDEQHEQRPQHDLSVSWIAHPTKQRAV